MRNKAGGQVQFNEFSYANDTQPRVKRWLIRSIEGLSGRNQYFQLYNIWRSQIVPGGSHIFGRMLDLTSIRLDVAQPWPPQNLPDTPLVLIANHPFGIGDGVAILALAEKLNRPFKVLINNELLKIAEIEPYALPVSFEETREALALNLKTRHEAVRLLKTGCTIIVFPAGGVATAPNGFGKAVDLPWKMFPARLIQLAQASVIPVHFAGQNGRIFHLASKVSMTLRLSLLVREFRKLGGKPISAKIGDTLSWAQLAQFSDRKELLQFLQKAVIKLAPETSAPIGPIKRLKALRRMTAVH
jgi:putative hemolysin